MKFFISLLVLGVFASLVFSTKVKTEAKTEDKEKDKNKRTVKTTPKKIIIKENKETK